MAAGAAGQTINGAGATFPYPIYARWFDAYQQLHPGVEINYQAIGSGAGIQKIMDGAVDFGASDSPLSDEQMAQAQAKLGTPVLHFPTVAGGAVPAYNIPSLQGEVRFTPESLSGIFLGAIRRWDDPAIARDNPGLRLPGNAIVVVHRADGSGTSYCFTDYLSKVSAEWKRRVGKGTTVAWPVGASARGNEGVAALIKQTPYSIGYVELVYALQNGISYGSVRNAAGGFIRADLASVAAAAEGGVASIPEDFRVSITDAPGRGAYPISTFTWLLVPEKGGNPATRKALVAYLRWALTDGQRITRTLQYAPLPRKLADREVKALSKIQ
jgi:phosphate transport system substrate-binding protein